MATASIYNRAQVSRIIGIRPPNLERDHAEFFAAGRQGPNGRWWTETQVSALCAHVGIEFDPANAAVR